MTTYKYTSSDNTVVHIIDDDGISRSSCLASTLPVDTIIEPADLPDPKLTRIAEIDSEILALEAKSHRAVRDSLAALAVTVPPSADDVAKIKEISAAIETLRLERRSLLAS